MSKMTRAQLTAAANDLLYRRRRKGPKVDSGRYPRDVRMKKYRPESIKSFVERNREHTGNDCLFVPGADGCRPAQVKFCGRGISAARYMALLTYGTPKSEGMHVRHLCGNGHLSFVNPVHLAWGSPGDNQSDANKHRAIGPDATTQDKINAVCPNA